MADLVPQTSPQVDINAKTQETAPVAAPASDSKPADPLEGLRVKYKGDFNELAKAKQSSDAEVGKLLAQIAELKKATTAAPTKPQDATPAASPTDAAKPEGQPQAAKGSPYAESLQALTSDLFLAGTPSPEALQSLKALGLSDAQVQDEVAKTQYVVAQKMKVAQSYVDTDVRELHKAAPQILNEQELAAVSIAIEHGLWGVLKDVEKRYKQAKDKGVQIEHGTVASTATDQYTSVEEYLKDKYSSDPAVRKQAEIKRQGTTSKEFTEALWKKGNIRPR